jgi:hypothetical protein
MSGGGCIASGNLFPEPSLHLLSTHPILPGPRRTFGVVRVATGYDGSRRLAARRWAKQSYVRFLAKLTENRQSAFGHLRSAEARALNVRNGSKTAVSGPATIGRFLTFRMRRWRSFRAAKLTPESGHWFRVPLIVRYWPRLCGRHQTRRSRAGILRGIAC